MLRGEHIFLRLLEREDLPYRVKWLNDNEISSGITIDSSVTSETKPVSKVVLDGTRGICYRG